MRRQVLTRDPLLLMLVELCASAFNQYYDFILVRLNCATAGDSCLSNMMKENKIHWLGVRNGSIVPTLILSASTLLVLLQADSRETMSHLPFSHHFFLPQFPQKFASTA